MKQLETILNMRLGHSVRCIDKNKLAYIQISREPYGFFLEYDYEYDYGTLHETLKTNAEGVRQVFQDQGFGDLTFI